MFFGPFSASFWEPKNGPGGGSTKSLFGPFSVPGLPCGPNGPKGAPEGAQGPPKWSFGTILDLFLDHLGPRVGPKWLFWGAPQGAQGIPKWLFGTFLDLTWEHL